MTVGAHKSRGRWVGGRDGQVMLEYVLVAGILTALVGMMALLLFVFKENGVRVLELIGANTP